VGCSQDGEAEGHGLAHEDVHFHDE
jgi:hypothetical protein